MVSLFWSHIYLVNLFFRNTSPNKSYGYSGHSAVSLEKTQPTCQVFQGLENIVPVPNKNSNMIFGYNLRVA